MGWVTGFDDMVYGEDGESPIKRTLERVLKEATKDEARLRIEIRTKAEGVPNSRQEHVFTIDPSSARAEGIMRALVQRLQESPGEDFSGELRINFTAAGSSQEKYGSFTRTIKRAPSYGSPGMDRVRIIGNMMNSGMDGEEGEEGMEGMEGGFNFNDIAALQGLAQAQMNGGGPSHEQTIQWLETTMGFCFRSMAQQMAMFERATRMMESYTLRFGMPHPVEAGIVEQRGGEGSGGGMGGLGLLPQLIQAASGLASAGGSANEAPPPQAMPPGAARQAAINGAARLVQSLPRVGHQPPPPPMGRPMPRGPDFDDDGDGGAYFDDEDMGFDASEMYEDDDEPMMGGGAPASIRDLPADQVKDLFVDWIRADPSRKKEVMDILPDLTKEVM